MKKIIPWILVSILAVSLVFSNLSIVRTALSEKSGVEVFPEETQTDITGVYNSSFSKELAYKCEELINNEIELKTEYQNVWFDIVDIDSNGAPELLFICRGDGYKFNQNYLYHITDTDVVLVSDQMIGNYVKTFCENGSVVIAMKSPVTGTGISSVAAYTLNSDLSNIEKGVAYYGMCANFSSEIEAYMNNDPQMVTETGDVTISVDEYKTIKIKYGYYSESLLHEASTDGPSISTIIYDQFGLEK